MPKSARPKTVRAAGGVLWRGSPGAVEVGLIHRPRYDDWTLPKGKVERGETVIAAAVREIGEETGHRVRLGRHLADVSYDLPNARKHVRYWSARSLGGDFEVNHEVDDFRWCTVDEAIGTLSYRQDRRVLRRFDRQPEADLAMLLLVRHAKAGRRSRYSGDDRLRPLDAEGCTQAYALVPILSAFGVDRLGSAPRVRCEQTLEPMSALLDSAIATEPALSEEAYRDDPAAARRRIRELAEDAGTGVVRAVCSQGKVIPPVLEWWAEEDGIVLPAARNRKASAWVLSLHRGRLVSADHIDSPLPRRERPEGETSDDPLAG